MPITVDTSDIDRLAADFEQANTRLVVAVRGAVTAAADLGVRVSKAWAPVLADQAKAPHRRPGELRDSIHAKVLGVTGMAGIAAQVTTNVFYARFLEYGTARTRPVPFMDKGAEAADAELAKTLPAAGLAALPK